MSSLKTGPSTRGLQIFAIPGVCLLVLFQGYFSQWLFYTSPDLAPGRLTTREAITFNALLLCLWWTYYKACTVDPGRYHYPTPPPTDPATTPTTPSTQPPRRWCKKCLQPKPPRAHHCRHCGRCIPKMDHHCPWTGNCVSLATFPHFLRFLVCANLSLWALLRLLLARASALWSARALPAYLGPTPAVMVAATALALVCAATALALGLLLASTVKGWVFNTTMIEGWEIERHEAVLDRYDRGGGQGQGEGPPPVRRVEFPYDLGLFDNMAQAMGTRNVLMWFFPLAGGPSVGPTGAGAGWEWEENGFNDEEGMWPPPDPERARRAVVGWPGAASRIARGDGGAYGGGGAGFREYASPEEAKAEFRRRQEDDLRRRGQGQRSGIIAELEEDEEMMVGDTRDVEYEGNDYDSYEEGMDGEPGWTNSDGDRLRDYGVDEEVEDEELIPLDPDEDVPIAELLRRRKVLTREDDV
ncbi:zf-DHHC-domain-containing protein [Phialemonium atrogriseum]|uniref:Palmitoyltransferase PFA4 n=1 Tax=Phialemonium atrogriseum TaxID=1093897 RepID=A0AAJ0FLU4_9PEZI|nr:zf-DHHC-domain-containing protein [Phialemonium atrogriseum]KAK1767069.1 zf-DHHC-domain-containing protein [Phialemonium atrogriseum]